MVMLARVARAADAPGPPAVLAVRAECDVESLPRIVGLLAQRGIVPTQLNCRRGARSLFVDIEIDGVDEPTLERLVAKIQAILVVERASLVSRQGRPHEAGLRARGSLSTGPA